MKKSKFSKYQIVKKILRQWKLGSRLLTFAASLELAVRHFIVDVPSMAT